MDSDKDKKQASVQQPVSTSVAPDELTGEFDIADLNEFFKKNKDLTTEGLDEVRKLDLTNMAPVVSEPAEKFYESVLPADDGAEPVAEPCLSAAGEDMVVASAESFYVQTGLEAAVDEAGSLTEEQKALLKTVGKLSDSTGFEESNPSLHASESLRPRDYSSSELNAIPTPKVDSSMSAGADLTARDQSFESRPLDGAGVVNAVTYGQLTEMQARPGGLLRRVGAQDHIPGSVDREALIKQGKPLSIEMKIGIGLVALAIPMFSLALYNESRSNSDMDAKLKAEAAALADESAERKSMANKMEQPHRQAASSGGSSGGGGSSGPYGGGGGGGGGTDAEWHPPSNPSPAPTGDQIAEGNKSIQTAQQMQALGQHAQAAAVLSAALGRCPGNVTLRMATVRCYMQMGNYRSARLICQEGMRNARSPGDFGMLQGLLSQIPSG